MGSEMCIRDRGRAARQVGGGESCGRGCIVKVQSRARGENVKKFFFSSLSMSKGHGRPAQAPKPRERPPCTMQEGSSSTWHMVETSTTPIPIAPPTNMRGGALHTSPT